MTENLLAAIRFSEEIRVANSRFIATVSPAFTIEEAKLFIKETKNKYRDATHNVPLYLIGFGSTVIAHSSDDGEPSGTAGRPALAVLKGSGLGDTAMVITRYFGGTKLGTGGLVKAYSNSARKVIDSVPKAKKVRVHQCQIICPYNVYELISREISKHHGIVNNEVFLDRVTLNFTIQNSSYSQLNNAIIELSHGKIHTEIIKEDQAAIIPILHRENN